MHGQHNTLDYTPTQKDPIGIELFTEMIGGISQTTIYDRFENGRVFARSVDPNEDHHDDVVKTWVQHAKRDGLDVQDHRSE